MDTDVKNAVQAADQEAQYDNEAKRLLSNKLILAHILVRTVDEFRGMNPKAVVPLIEGEPQIGSVPVEPGLTNQSSGQGAQRVVGLNTESGEIHEGMIRFDIIFYVRTRDGLSQIIVNVEAQKDSLTPYSILNRAIFYVCRMVSSQKERDFTSTNYDDIKRVFSIWICMNQEEDSINYVHLNNDSLLGSRQWSGKLDMLNVVLVGLARQLPAQGEKHELHRLLGALFSEELSVDEKLNIMEKEYDIPTKGTISEGVNVMCNLSQGIRERGEARGEARERERQYRFFIMNMYRKGYSLAEIAEIAEKPLREIEAIVSQEK